MQARTGPVQNILPVRQSDLSGVTALKWRVQLVQGFKSQSSAIRFRKRIIFRPFSVAGLWGCIGG